ncbi:MAG: hypothetical protein ACI4EB_00355 [Bilifractor sp.]
MRRIDSILNGKETNHILPFFWQHGEDEETLRTYMKVIDESGCCAVCVESRPHPDFCGETWWRDMDIILDEAKKRKMKVWILDDSHFPTGYANGALKAKPVSLRRQSIYTETIRCHGRRKFSCDLKKIFHHLPTTAIWKIVGKKMNEGADVFDDDCVLDAAVLRGDSKMPVSVPYEVTGDRLTAELPEGTEKLYITILTRNAGIHRDYINMMDAESVRVLIDAVYEPHYAHYRDEFGGTIAGFFSDEPELGNGVYFSNQVKIGNDFDMPWSRPLSEEMEKAFGRNWKSRMPLLFDEGADRKSAAETRLIYMDAVTNLVKKNFSEQIGSWCRSHGVSYIGHVIEDNNQHCRCGAGIGHYFRGLAGQDMAGIDDIGGQVIPFREDAPAEGMMKWMGGRDGEFYHYCLGALGASLAAVDPRKKGRCMCEIFGNYGWSEGPRLEKYLADHFMVQGINYFVPHAFSPKAYPDPDCPPHFYAHGNNPQYRSFGHVIAYMNRICSLLSDGKPVCGTAVLYQAEQEWMGRSMPDQKILRILMENQMIAHILPEDVLDHKNEYGTRLERGQLFVNGNVYHTLLIPKSEFITARLAKELAAMADLGISVCFVDALPEAVIGSGSAGLAEALAAKCPCIRLGDVPSHTAREMRIFPANTGIRYFHYRGEEEVLYFVNENPAAWSGEARLEGEMDLIGYDAWENALVAVPYVKKDGQTVIPLSLDSCESLILIRNDGLELRGETRQTQVEEAVDLTDGRQTWIVSSCRSIDYPTFKGEEEQRTLTPFSRRHKNFSGFIAYETEVVFPVSFLQGRQSGHQIRIFVESAGEDAELFWNGKSIGTRVLSPCCFDVTEYAKEGSNTLRIEVATTLERERGINKGHQAETGITGRVLLQLMR